MTAITIRSPLNMVAVPSEIIAVIFDEAESAFDQALRIARESEVRLFLPLIMCGLATSTRREEKRARERHPAGSKARGRDAGGTLQAWSSYRLISAPPLRPTRGSPAWLEPGARLHGRSPAKGAMAALKCWSAFYEANILASEGTSSPNRSRGWLRRTIEIAERLEAGPLLRRRRRHTWQALADAGRTVEAQDELAQALALFDRSESTVQMEHVKATLSKFSDV